MDIILSEDNRFPQLWESLRSADRISNPLYSKLNSEYSAAYNAGREFVDKSFVVVSNGIPVCGMTASISTLPDGRKVFDAASRPLMYFENADAPGAQSGFQCAEKVISGIIEEYKPLTVLFRLRGGILNPLAKHVLSLGGQVASRYTQVIDLTQSVEALLSDVRKSFRNLINRGEKILDVSLIDHASIEQADIDAFRELHAEVSGRVTRPKASWDIQLEMVRQREAFMVFGRHEGRLVTASFYAYSAKSCCYFSSAAVREMFDMPLTHAPLWRAILHAKMLGCESFELGDQLFQAPGGEENDPKLLSIASFKRGFGGNTMVELDITLEAA